MVIVFERQGINTRIHSKRLTDCDPTETLSHRLLLSVAHIVWVKQMVSFWQVLFDFLFEIISISVNQIIILSWLLLLITSCCCLACLLLLLRACAYLRKLSLVARLLLLLLLFQHLARLLQVPFMVFLYASKRFVLSWLLSCSLWWLLLLLLCLRLWLNGCLGCIRLRLVCVFGSFLWLRLIAGRHQWFYLLLLSLLGWLRCLTK
jgi:hypothetical protein